MRHESPRVVHRSYRPGMQNALRLTEGASISVELEAGDSGPGVRAAEIRTDRWSDDRHWTTALRRDGSRFAGTLSFSEPGLYRMKAFLGHGENEALLPDTVPYAYFVVDPGHIGTLRMYTLIPAVSGTISDWIDALDGIESMGFNALQLLPVSEMGASQSPYAASDPCAIDPAYSSFEDPERRMDEFRAFVKELRKRSIHLCVDLVLNHVAVGGRVATEHPEWLAEDPQEHDGVKRAGWHDGKRWNAWRDLALLNYEPFALEDREALWSYMTRYALLWASLAAETGGIVRLDNLHSSYRPFMLHALRTIREKHRSLIVLGELFTTEDLILKSATEYGLNLLLATPWEHKFVPELRAYLRYVHGKRNHLRYYFPITSHDSKSPAEEFGDRISTIPRLAVSMLMGPGPSGIVQGVENGLATQPSFIGAPAKIKLPLERNFRDLIRRLCRLRELHPEFGMPGNLIFVDDAHEAILAGVRLDIDSGRPRWLVCANFDTGREHSLVVDLSRTGAEEGLLLESVLDDSAPAVVQGRVTVALGPAEIGLYRISRT